MSSSDYRLNQMIKVFERCLDEAEVFKRDVPNKSLFNWIEKAEKDGSRWAVLAAGLSEEAGENYFKPGSSSIQHATVLLQVSGGGRAEILLQMRPVEWPNPCPTFDKVHRPLRARRSDSAGRDHERSHQP